LWNSGFKGIVQAFNNAHQKLGGNCIGTRLFGKYRHGWWDNIESISKG